MTNLKEKLLTVFAESTVRSLLNGTRTPSLKTALDLQDKFGIPPSAWRDIKSFISTIITESKDQVNSKGE